MTSRNKRARVDLIVVVIFIVVLLLIMFTLLTGLVWIELDIPQLGLWINILLPLEIAVISVVFAYSFVRYTQDQYFRDLALILIALNAIIMVLFYLLTNVAAIDWSPFASRERNRTIVAAFSFIVGPPLLFGSLTEEAPVSKWQRNISLLYGAFITPTVSTWFFLNPEPVFIDCGTGEIHSIVASGAQSHRHVNSDGSDALDTEHCPILTTGESVSDHGARLDKQYDIRISRDCSCNDNHSCR